MSKIPRSSKAAVLFTCITAALAGLLFGLDIGVVSGARVHFQSDFGIGDSVGEQIVSALLWGAVAGTFASGHFARKYGRRPTLIASAIIFVLGSIACGLATSAWMLIGARFILGTAVGAASFTAPLYLSEVAPQKIRGSLISMYQLMITIGILLAFLSDTWLSSYSSWTFGGQGNWRLMLGIVAIPASLMLVGVLILPESPRWLRLAGRNENARKVLETLREAAEVEPELQAIDESLKIKQAGGVLFKTNPDFRRVIFLGVTLQMIQQLTGINVIMYYAPKIFEVAGFESALGQMWGTVAIGVTNVLATFIAIAFVDKLGRKPIMVAGLWVMGISMIAVGSILNHGVAGNQGLSYLAIAFLMVFIIGFAMSAGPIVWILCSEIYPLSGRDFGVTVSTATNWIVNGIVGATFLTLLNKAGEGNTFWLYGLMNIGFLVVFKFFVPETKGVSLEKIEENLYAGKPLREIGNL